MSDKDPIFTDNAPQQFRPGSSSCNTSVINKTSTLIALTILLAAIRIYCIFIYQHPLNAVFSDSARHLDNARYFLTPGPMGAANPYLYQLWLYCVITFAGESYWGVGLSALFLSLAYPFCWFLFAKEVLKSHTRAWQVSLIIGYLPSSIYLYSYFLSETLLLPLLGASLFFTFYSLRTGSRSGYLTSCLFWTLGILTRPVVLPLAIVCGIGLLFTQKRKLLAIALAGIIFACGAVPAARHSFPHFESFSPFGNDGKLVFIYFLSGKLSYEVQVNKAYYYVYQSPSYSISPFHPFGEWRSSRQGSYKFSFSGVEHGADLNRTIQALLKENWRQLPRLMFENILFLTLGHCWPGATPGTFLGSLCLWERFLWLPLWILCVYFCLNSLRSQRLSLYPIVFLGFTIWMLTAHFTVMEGRYRKPIEPLIVVTLFWALSKVRRSSLLADSFKPLISTQTSSEYDQHWDKLRDFIRYNPGARHRRRLVLELATSCAATDCLDVGCGTAEIFPSLKEIRPELKISGSDFSAEVLKRNQEYFPDSLFHVLDIEKNHLDQQYDLVICSEVIEHLHDRKAAFANLSAMLKPQGFLIVTCPAGKVFETERIWGHVSHPTKSELFQLARSNSLEVKSYLNWGFPFYLALKFLTNCSPSLAIEHFTVASYSPFKRAICSFIYMVTYLSLPCPWGCQSVCLFQKIDSASDRP